MKYFRKRFNKLKKTSISNSRTFFAKKRRLNHFYTVDEDLEISSCKYENGSLIV